MRRTNKTKSDTNSDSEEEVSSLGQVDDNNGTKSGDEADSSTSSGRKRDSRNQAKKSYVENKSSDEETEATPSKRKRKSANEIPENGKSESDQETEKNKNVNKKKNKLNKTDDESGEETVPEVEKNGKSPSKGKKKGKTTPKKKETQEDEEEYEVEKLVEQRTIKGRRQFLVRWKGYEEDSDTWENEKDLNCDKLIEEFLAEKEEEEKESVEEKKDKVDKKTKSKKQNKTSKKKNNKTGPKADENNGNDDEKSVSTTEYEVGKIVDVHFNKDKTREFLIRWKGFSPKEDTWEPEENLNCPKLISQYMEKVEKSRSIDSRELRENRAHTKRYTLTMHGDKRQSRRNAAKERMTYFECDN